MVTLYVAGKKVAWADAEAALSEPGIDWAEVAVRNESGADVWRFAPVENDPEPLVVDVSR